MSHKEEVEAFVEGYTICNDCMDRVKTDEEGIVVKNKKKQYHSTVASYHLDCWLESNIGFTNSDVEATVEDVKRWFDQFHSKYLWFKSSLEEKYLGFEDLYKEVYGIYKDLFPTGLISKRVKIAENIMPAERIEGLDKTFMDGQDLYISSRGIGTVSDDKKVADYKNDGQAVLLMTAYRNEIAENMSSFKDRTKKFKRFSDAIRENLDLSKAARVPRSSPVKDVEAMDYTDKRKVRVSPSHKTGALRLRKDVSGDFHVGARYGNGGYSQHKFDFRPKIRFLDEYMEMWPVLEQILEIKNKFQEGWEEAYESKIDKIQDAVDDYLAIYMI